MKCDLCGEENAGGVEQTSVSVEHGEYDDIEYLKTMDVCLDCLEILNNAIVDVIDDLAIGCS